MPAVWYELLEMQKLYPFRRGNDRVFQCHFWLTRIWLCVTCWSEGVRILLKSICPEVKFIKGDMRSGAIIFLPRSLRRSDETCTCLFSYEILIDSLTHEIMCRSLFDISKISQSFSTLYIHLDRYNLTFLRFLEGWHGMNSYYEVIPSL